MFFVAFLISLAWRPLKYPLLKWAYPIIYGTVWIVFVYSSTLIWENGNIFLRTTTEQGGHLTVGQAHTGDILVHTLPAFVTLIFTAVAWYPLRRIVETGNSYGVYFVLSPLLPAIVYNLLFDAEREYPSDIDGVFGTFIVTIIAIVFNGFLFLLLLADYPVVVKDVKIRQETPFQFIPTGTPELDKNI